MLRDKPTGRTLENYQEKRLDDNSATQGLLQQPAEQFSGQIWKHARLDPDYEESKTSSQHSRSKINTLIPKSTQI